MIAVAELAQVLELLQRYGISQIKMDGLELSFAELARAPAPAVAQPIAVDAPLPEPEKIEHKTEELTNVMKLSDMELLDRLFPDTTEPEQATQ